MNLREMTLLELAAAVGEAMHDQTKQIIPFAAELQRRQRMLEAAESIARAIAVHDAEQVPLDVLTEYDAYEAAKPKQESAR